GQRLKGIRVFTLGIDRAVNEGFLRRLADRGGGSCELVESEDRLDEVLTAVHRRIGTPLLTGLSVNGDDLAIEPGEIVPRRLPDLFAGSPLLILGRYRGRPAGALTIRAAGADGRAWSQPVPAQVRDNPAIAAAWARGQVRQLEDRYAARDGDRSQLEKAIVAVSLKFQVLCRFTAYVAVDRSRAVNPGGTLHRITQPVEQPEGWADMSLMTLSAPGAALAVPDWALPKRRTSGIRGSAKARGLLPAPPPEDSTLLSRDAAAPASFSPGAIRREAPLQASDDEATRATPPGSSDSGVTRLLGTPAYLAPERVRATPHKGLSDRFDVLGRIGSGAMGQIFKAFERQGGRLVIVSVTAATGLGTVALARWRKLKEILGRLRHPAIVPILEVDTSEEMVRIVTPLVEGRTLEERLRLSGRMDPREAAALVAELAEALQLAHQQGLIHGDVTPSNILLGDDGHPRLLGFGATPPGSSDSGVTRLLGTPAYLAPERVRARPAPADALSDVYSLGVVLYEILTGQPPFRGASVAKLLPQILEQAPTPPRQVVRSIPAELETICLKAMAKNPAQRYQTAGELAAALGEFLKPRRRQGFWK
ncbi:MAG TPA: serine/threonine-protein kinase, partial [Isosphaeraceae bacterium]|nr:serine/threonine-protein kinase [Isosphaeraceae bacterium]